MKPFGGRFHELFDEIWWEDWRLDNLYVLWEINDDIIFNIVII